MRLTITESQFRVYIRKKTLLRESTDALFQQYLQQLESLSPLFAQAAQGVYDQWEQTGDEYDEYGGGGICDDVAEAMCDVIHNKTDLECITQYDSGACHTSVITYDHDSQLAFSVDIHPFNYETGGGYSWTKIPDVKFHEGMVKIQGVDYEYLDFDDGGY